MQGSRPKLRTDIDLRAPGLQELCACVSVFSKRPPLSFSLPPISQHLAKDYPVMFRPNSAGVFPSTTAALLRLTKNDCLRTSKSTLISTHILTSIYTHPDTQCINTHLCPAGSPLPLPSTHSHTGIQTPL